MTGTLFVVPNTLDLGTPSPPPVTEVLPAGVLTVAARLAHWIAENAKTTRALLKRIDAVVPLALPLQAITIAELPRPPKGRDAIPDVTSLLAPALAGHDVGLVSEAGLPAVADPGALVVAAAHRLGIPVQPLAGPSSLLLALAASGLNGQSFAFVGYVPSDAAARGMRLRELESASRRLQQTQLLIETPYRNTALMEALVATLAPSTRLSVSVGLTLAGGFNRSASVAQWRERPQVLPADVPAVFCFLAA